MIFIPESVIDSTAESLETADFEQEIISLSAQQPALMAYIFSEDADLLTEAERSLMLYVILVIVKSIEKATQQPIPKMSEKAIEAAEEKNWALLEPVTAKRFRDRLDVFFDNYPQEDLLAFVEDSLVDDEDGIVTKEGREPMFVSLKSVVDVLTAK